MKDQKIQNYLNEVLKNMPSDWLNLTTHRLDIYNEELAKIDFLDQFEALFHANNSKTNALSDLPTAYDYIRLGHPLSSILEWAIANLNQMHPQNAICFSSQTIPILAILRTNLLHNKETQILYKDTLPQSFDADLVRRVYGYNFELKKIDNDYEFPSFNGSTVLISEHHYVTEIKSNSEVDFNIALFPELGSVLLINGASNDKYIDDVQHVRRRETIAMTPANCLSALKSLIDNAPVSIDKNQLIKNKARVLETINTVTNTSTEPLVASSGLSIQYAIMMGLVDNALQNYKGKTIKFIVPPNCYGGTNDQARRVAECLENVDIVDLLVDGDNNMVQSIDSVLENIAKEDAVPYIIAEIPTNPRVEVPDLLELKNVLTKIRKTKTGEKAIDPVFILDQTFCPNVHFLGDGDILSSVRTISFASGSKFPSGGKCTAGYCVGNKISEGLMEKINIHLELCANEATPLQYELLADQMPSMNKRIIEAYKNTREFVNFIHETLPGAKINFVSEDLANQCFTPSVFSLDLPTKGSTDEDRENYKRALNLKLINMMITEIPNECKYCVSYGQLKGSYWTIPATSTQGTTKEGDKDYIVRASLSHNMDMERHKKVFKAFSEAI